MGLFKEKSTLKPHHTTLKYPATVSLWQTVIVCKKHIFKSHEDHKHDEWYNSPHKVKAHSITLKTLQE